MTLRTGVVALSLILAACNSTPGRELQPGATTNEVALSNLNLGIEYIRRGDFEKALEKLDRAREADPSYPLTYNTYGVLYERLGDVPRAEQNFKKALQLDRGNSATLNNYGRFLCRHDRPDEAEDAFERAADNPLYSTPEIPMTNAGTCAMNQGRNKQAEKYFRRALEMNPAMPSALLQMSRMSYDQGKPMPARGYLERYLAIAKPTPQSLWLGIQIETKLGDADAVSSYALLLKNTFPESREAQLLNASGTR